MSHLFKFPVPHAGEFPGALFKAHDAIPLLECEAAGGATTVQELAELAHTQSKAHTICNGQLYTDLTDAMLTAHCSVAYAPQT